MSDSSTPMIEARGLSKFYGDFAAVRDMTFEIQRGEIVAFLGPNGAGKSTTMRMLTGYLAPSEGSARIAGHDMASDRLAAAVKLGYLPESGPLYPDMTPAEMLNFFADARGLRSKAKKNLIASAVEMTDLSTVYYKPIGKLSKGFRQRVGMAQSLLHEPEVLIMDEPTAGLDPNQTEHVRNTLLKLGKDKTILLSTHILQEVEAMASRVIVVDEGIKVADGPIDEFRGSDKTLATEFRRLTVGSAT
jgi:ABC-2 type transport system ATP-binding protein